MALKSLALLVGSSDCNARCRHCAGVPLRKYAPKEDGFLDEDLFYKTIRDCYSQGARALSVSSSGEPTLSPLTVTRTLEIVHGLREEGIEFSPINLYSNGIRIGEEEDFSDKYLPLWKSLGLSVIYLTVHDVDERENAKIYRVKTYPSLELILTRIHAADLLARANLVLNKETIDTFDKFRSTVEKLREIGFDYISAWPIRNAQDNVDPKLAPSQNELDLMGRWVEEQSPDHRIRLLGEGNRVVYETGQKLTLFPDGTLSNTWCNH